MSSRIKLTRQHGSQQNLEGEKALVSDEALTIGVVCNKSLCSPKLRPALASQAAFAPLLTFGATMFSCTAPLKHVDFAPSTILSCNPLNHQACSLCPCSLPCLEGGPLPQASAGPTYLLLSHLYLHTHKGPSFDSFPPSSLGLPYLALLDP